MESSSVASMSMEVPRSTNAVKTYIMSATSSWSGRQNHFEVRHESPEPIMTVRAKGRGFGFTNPQVEVQLPDKSIVAACKLQGLGWKFGKLLYLGSPDCSDPADWIELKASGIMDPSIYRFQWKGSSYAWKRTHDAKLGGSVVSYNTHKLIDEGTGSVLCVHVHKWSWAHRYTARLEFMVSLHSNGLG